MLKKKASQVPADHYYNRGGLRDILLQYVTRCGSISRDDLQAYGESYEYDPRYVRITIRSLIDDWSLECSDNDTLTCYQEE